MNRVLAAGANCTAALPDLRPEVQVADPLAISGIVQTPAAGTEKHLGTVPVTLTITYTNGSTSTCNVLLSVVDATPPLLVPMAHKVVEHPSPWTFDTPQATDACGGVTLTELETRTNRTCGPGYVATRVWRAVDAFDNSRTCTQLVSVVDSVPPLLSSLSDFQVECGIAWAFEPPFAADKGLNATCVFDNSVNDLATRFEFATNEFGNEIILSGDGRYMQGFSFEFWSTNITGAEFYESPDVTVRLRFYANDGPLFNGYRAPGTLLYDSGEFWLGPWPTPRATVVYDAYDLGVLAPHPLSGPVPGSFTWTVQFSGLGASDRAGLDVYSPPISGTGYGDVWMLTEDGWKLRENPDLELNFAARAFASSNTVDIRIAGTTTNQVTLTTYTAIRTWQVTDLCGNTAEESQTVSVLDTAAPVIVYAPTNRSLVAGTNCVTLVPDFTTELQANDACGATLISQQPAPGSEAGPGPHVITLFVADASANISSCSLLVTVEVPSNPPTPVVISEFMAKNTLYPDDDGAFSDWVEIWNKGRCPVDLSGWYLTDKTNQLTQWQFPSTNIAPGQYMVIWLSGKNRRVPGAPLHSNFSIKDEGEYLALTWPDGITIQSDFYPVFPPQLPNVSYGTPAAGGTNSYLAVTTPGAANSVATNFPVIPLVFSPTRGWYSNAISVSIQASSPIPNILIYYTTDGSVPAPGNGQIYAQPVAISNTTPLRAAAYALGYQPQVTTHSYIYPEQTAAQTGEGLPQTWGYYFYVPEMPRPARYAFNGIILSDPNWSNQVPSALRSLPTVSISMSADDLFGTNGIYANSLGQGDDWERPCSAEYFAPAQSSEFQINCGIQIQGDYSSIPDVTPKHNFRLLFKQRFGGGRLVHGVYPGSPVTEFDTLVLHASCNDHWVYFGPRAQMQRDQWCADTQRETGGYGTQGIYVNLYMNGLYWGLYNLGERPDASYAAHYLGGTKSDYDAFNAWELKEGTEDALNSLVMLARAGITNEAAYSTACSYLNIPHFIDYLLINFYAATGDWPENNYWLCGAVASKGIPFHFFSWDAEFSFYYGVTLDRTGINFADIGEVYTALRNWPEFRMLFGDHAHRMLCNRGALTPEAARSRWMRRAEQIRLAIIAESARWGITNKNTGLPLTQGDWLREQQNILTNWFPQRTGILLSQLRAGDLYPSLEAPIFFPHGGIVSGSLQVSVSAPADAAVCYTTDGTDPRLPDGSISGTAVTLTAGNAPPILITGNTHLKARSHYTNTWSALNEADYAQSTEVEMRIVSVERQNNTTVLNCTAWPGAAYSMLASTNLLSGGWCVVGQAAPFPDGTFRFADRGASNDTQRFYKLRWP